MAYKTPGVRGYITNPDTGLDSDLSNGVRTGVQFDMIRWAYNQKFGWWRWWEIGYKRPPRRYPLEQILSAK